MKEYSFQKSASLRKNVLFWNAKEHSYKLHYQYHHLVYHLFYMSAHKFGYTTCTSIHSEVMELRSW